MDHERFARHFIAARDGELHSHDSWRQKIPDAGPLLCLRMPIEEVGEDAIEGVLMAAAGAGVRYAHIGFRYVAYDDALRALATLVHGTFMPLRERGVLGTVAHVLHIEGQGWMHVALFHMDARPPEERRMTPAEIAYPLLRSLGFGKVGASRVARH